ncbi:unannotated protein [freshwater metagenome]|uniref:Unannotated protein n=1 Tax=freshwater metagenome TaxID=449393 RepID=A0A6J6D051_9ZZZZ
MVCSHWLNVSPGAPKIKSRDVLKPRSLAIFRAIATFSGLWVRSNVFNTSGTADCIPIEILLKPADRKEARLSLVTESGLASKVISASEVKPNSESNLLSICARSAAGSREGVPPPTKTEVSFLEGEFDSLSIREDKEIS